MEAPAATDPAPTPAAAPPRPAPAPRNASAPAAPVLETILDEPQANLAIRVRRSLDFRLSDLVHELRRDGVKTSKVEIVEMLLSELPPRVTDDLRLRLRTFRDRPQRTDG